MAKWAIDKSFDFCYGHRVWSQELDTKYSLDSCLACRHLHGHQGKIKLFLESEILDKGMVTDFKHLNIFKKWLDDELDHKFIVDINDPLFEDLFGLIKLDENTISYFNETSSNIMAIYNEYGFAKPDMEQIDMVISMLDISEKEKQAIFEKFEGLCIVNFIPTSENLCKWIYEISNKMLNGLIKVSAVEFWETPKSHCRYSED